MRGEFIRVWSETRREIWQPLIDELLLETEEGVPEDVFCELYRELSGALGAPPSVQELANVIDDPLQSRQAFDAVQAEDIVGERALVDFFEAAHSALEDLGGDRVANRYFNLIAGFVEKFSLRYDLRRPFVLCPTLPGVFASLLRDVRSLTASDPHLDALMKEFENAVRDLRHDCSDSRIKTCMVKQINLIEAMAKKSPGITEQELGGICNQLAVWPHGAVKASLKNLYGFASDYPGIRHGGNPAGALRAIDMRDMIAVSIVLAGFTPYLSDGLNAEAVYRRV